MKKNIIYDSSIIRFASLSSLRHKKQGVRNALIDQNQDIINLELEVFKKSKIVTKRNSVTGKMENIPINKIRVIKTILI